MWLAQTVGIPLLYPILVILHILYLRVITWVLTTPPYDMGFAARSLRYLGARPSRSFDTYHLFLSYAPAGFFYLNMFFNSAIGKCFKMIRHAARLH